jgi:hypothetical protein
MRGLGVVNLPPGIPLHIVCVLHLHDRLKILPNFFFFYDTLSLFSNCLLTHWDTVLNY